jgi:hypothetical protein
MGLGRGSRLGVAVVTALILVPIQSAEAQVVHKSAPTEVERRVTRAADGTVTLEGIYTSPDPHCLEARRWKRLSDGNFHEGFDAVLGFSIGHASPPNGGYLRPVSPAGRSPFRWRAVWAGTTLVWVEKSPGLGPPRFVRAPISEATELKFYYWLPASREGGSVYITSYKRNGNLVKLTCGARRKDHNYNYDL